MNIRAKRDCCCLFTLAIYFKLRMGCAIKKYTSMICEWNILNYRELFIKAKQLRISSFCLIVNSYHANKNRARSVAFGDRCWEKQTSGRSYLWLPFWPQFPQLNIDFFLHWSNFNARKVRLTISRKTCFYKTKFIALSLPNIPVLWLTTFRSF